MSLVRGICSVLGCGRPHKSRGYCASHYQVWKRGGLVTQEIKARDRTPHEHCSEEDCRQPVKAAGLCKMHYQRKLRHGHTKTTRRTKPQKKCTVEGCDSWLYAKGMCNAHYLRFRVLPKKYGITMAQANEMLKEQGGVCAACGGAQLQREAASGRLTDFDVDHNHSTGDVRGLLCSNCNRGIGLLADDIKIVASVAIYLAKHSPDPVATLDAAISQLQTARGAFTT